jgi:endonuclease YncB( thermonuclease family)
MIKLFLSVTFATVLMGLVAYGQTSSSPSTTVATGSTGTTETTTTTTESFGTVTDFTPGQTLVLKTEAGEPARYKFSKTVTYQTADGRTIEASKIRKDSKVRVHYVKDGDDLLVDKVIVTKDRD